jgi:oligopeptide transport system permease protein
MLDALSQDYIRTPRAKGVPMTRVIFKHALRNALIPVITYLGPELSYILTGSLVIENIFTIGGLGQQFVQSINNRDYSMIMGTTIFLAIIMVFCNLLSDILYKVVDPRIKLEA